MSQSGLRHAQTNSSLQGWSRAFNCRLQETRRVGSFTFLILLCFLSIWGTSTVKGPPESELLTVLALFLYESTWRHTVHHFYERGFVENTEEEVTNDSVFTYGHPARPLVQFMRFYCPYLPIPSALSQNIYSEWTFIQNSGCNLTSAHKGKVPLDYIRNYEEIMFLFW